MTTVLNKLLTMAKRDLIMHMLTDDDINELINESIDLENTSIYNESEKYSVVACSHVSDDNMFLLEVRIFDEDGDGEHLNSFLWVFNSDFTVYDKFINDVWSFRSWTKTDEALDNGKFKIPAEDTSKEYKDALERIIKEFNAKNRNGDTELTLKMLENSIGEHKECVLDNYIEVVQYGDGVNTSIECVECNEVIIDSETIDEEALASTIVYSLNGEDVLNVLDEMDDNTIEKLKELNISDKEVIDFVKYKMEIPWSEYVEETINSFIYRMERCKKNK